MKIIYSLLLLTIWVVALGQEKPLVELTLEDCINKAVEENISIKIARNNEVAAQSNRAQAIMNFLPTINARVDYSWNIGNFFDQTAARQVTATTRFSNPVIFTDINLFSGLSNHFLLNQRTNELRAAQESTKNAELNVRANVLGFYLNVILGEENIRISQNRVDLLEAQLDRAQKRESVGVGNMEDVNNFQSQLATERLNLQTLVNSFERNKLTLLQSMQLDPTAAEYDVRGLTILDEDLLLEIDPFGEVLSQSLESNPQYMQSQYSLLASEAQLKQTSAARLPSLAASAGLGSRYSSNGARNPETGEIEFNADYITQMDYNFAQSAGITLSIPLFNNYRAGNNVQNARVGVANAELSVQQAEQNVTNAIQQVYLDLIAAQTTYRSALENLEALDQTFEFMKRRFETGNTDFYTYLESLNNKNRAEIQLINAKYSIILRQKVLDAYRGK